MLKQACLEACTWPTNMRLAVNLSAAQFKSRTLVQDVSSVLKASGFPAQRLELEITETVMLQDTEATLALCISMDDSGTGYSSLTFLRKFPFNRIKIDRSFISELPEGRDAAAILKAVASLSQDLGMSTTAEGVENMAQLERIRRQGCDEVQGYLFNPALSSNGDSRTSSEGCERSQTAA
ncbi:EAL domain-containing protein [Microvirga arabica]|nr:EAL domain-containing protein [Microvirga arabica]